MNTQTVIQGVTLPPAPKRTTEMVKTAVMAYIERHSLNSWGDVAQAAGDIARSWHPGMDGYELAKALESACYWDGLSLQDAEDLDSIGSVVREAEEKARKAWALEWDIQPPFPVGTALTRGVIAYIDKHSVAIYGVKEHGCTQGGRYLLVRFEDAEVQENAA